MVLGSLHLLRKLTLQRIQYKALLNDVNKKESGLQTQLTTLNAEYKTILEYCGIGIIILDKHGVIVKANSKSIEWLNSATQNFIGRTLLEVSLSNELDELFKDAKNGGLIQRELKITSTVYEKEGVPARLAAIPQSDLVITVAPIIYNTDEVRYLFIIENVSQLRRLERVRRDFVANVSHELRTPLTSIRAVAETLQQSPPADRQVADRFLGMIIAESERLTRISDDLLTLTAAESRPPSMELFDFGALVEVVANRLQKQAEQSKVSLACTTSKELYIFANPDQLEQVVLNLIDNAIKYTQTGGTVTVTANTSSDDITLTVKDTGIGIMQSDLPRIFERFYRVDKARSRETGGTGLGLSIVKHITEAHGGCITVESMYNEGSVFIVTLPLAKIDGYEK